MHLKGALHVHTVCSDGRLTIKQAINVYESRGFDFIAFTDHDHLLRPNCYKEIAGINTDMILFTGVELTMFERGYVHVNRIDGDTETLHVFNHPAELNLPFDKVKQRIMDIAKKIPLDAVEITSKGFRTPEYDTPEIPFNKVATDDAHTRLMCGRAWIELDCLREKDKILRAIKTGDYLNCFIDKR